MNPGNVIKAVSYSWKTKLHGRAGKPPLSFDTPLRPERTLREIEVAVEGLRVLRTDSLKDASLSSTVSLLFGYDLSSKRIEL
jgi:hypothetical protein